MVRWKLWLDYVITGMLRFQSNRWITQFIHLTVLNNMWEPFFKKKSMYGASLLDLSYIM